MKIIFAGSPAFAVPALGALLDAGKEVVAVITQPDKSTGRKKILTATPVKAFALERGLRVYEFAKIKEHTDELKSLGADVMFTCAYGQILTRSVLDVFPLGVWNIHASLLPKFRGASPVQAAILAGERHTGVTVMRTELSLDTGDMLLVKRCETGKMTCGELTEKLSCLGAEAIKEAADILESGNVQTLMQNEAEATYCKKVEKQDAKLDFSENAEILARKVRAFSPQPSAYCMQNGVILNILNAEAAEGNGVCGEVIAADKRGITVGCGAGALLITELQPSGGKRMRAADYVNGRKIKVGDKLD